MSCCFKMGCNEPSRGGSHLELKLLVSNFSSEPIRGDLHWKVTMDGQAIGEGHIAQKTPAPQGELLDVGRVDAILPDVGKPTRLKISLKLGASHKAYENDWTTWLYPAVICPKKLPIPVFVDEAFCKSFAAWKFRPIPARGDLESRAVYLTEWPCDPRIVDAAERGASVVAIGMPGQLLNSFAMTFRTSWWKAGEKREQNNTGTFVYDHPATKAMAPDGWCDDGWFHLIQGSRKFDLEKTPSRPEVLIRALPSLMLPVDEALLFQVGVGNGSLVVSGLNHRAADGRPENEWILAKLLEHAATFPSPKPKMASGIFKSRRGRSRRMPAGLPTSDCQ